MCSSTSLNPGSSEGHMTTSNGAGNREAALADHAGSLLCRLLMDHPEVLDIEIVGQTDLPDAIIYSLGVILPGGRELLVDVSDV